MKRNSPSRRDDLKSLAYILIFLLNNGKLSEDIDLEAGLTDYSKVFEQKEAKGFKGMCVDRAECLIDFA